MNYCIAACDRFEAVADPYNNGRNCFKFKMLERQDINGIMKDPNFLFIHENTIYFKS